MKSSDRELLSTIVDNGAVCWKGRAKPPTAALKRLAAEGMIEVETHSVSLWNFGPGFRYNDSADERAARVALRARLPRPTREGGTQVWAYPTSLGNETITDKERWRNPNNT